MVGVGEARDSAAGLIGLGREQLAFQYLEDERVRFEVVFRGLVRVGVSRAGAVGLIGLGREPFAFWYLSHERVSFEVFFKGLVGWGVARNGAVSLRIGSGAICLLVSRRRTCEFRGIPQRLGRADVARDSAVSFIGLRGSDLPSGISTANV